MWGAAPLGRVAAVPSRKHQSLIKLIQTSPRLLVELVRACFGFELPSTVRFLRGPEVVHVLGRERIADGVLVAWRDGEVQETVVVEVQLRKAPGKRKAWAIYVVGTWAELEAPTTLVVLTPSKHVAQWASEAIDLGHGKAVIQPLALGPLQIPATMSLTEARARPDRLALSVLIHGHKRGSIGLARTALKVARELASGNEARRVLADLIVSGVNDHVRKIVEAEMIVDGEEWFSDVIGNFMKGRSEGRKEGLEKGLTKGLTKGRKEGRTEGLEKGRIEGVVRSLWTVLEARGLRPSAAQRARIERCRDYEQLEVWLRRAMLAKSMAEVLRREPRTQPATARARAGRSSARTAPDPRSAAR